MTMVLQPTAQQAREKPLYVIYLGSRDRQSFTPDEREGIAGLVCRYFPSFTLLGRARILSRVTAAHDPDPSRREGSLRS